MPAQQTLVLFARAPEPGQVKTRLAPLLGPEGASRLYRAFLVDAARTYARSEWTPVLDADPAGDHPLLRDLFAAPWRREDQAPGDLGARLTAAFRREAALGAPSILAVGSDHPALPRKSLSEAFRAVRQGGRQAAIIPAEDGGYCAIALSRDVAPERVFDAIPWSSAEVLETTLARLADAGAAVSVLGAFYDVDRPEDVGRLVQDLASRDPAGEDFPAATARALQDLAAEAAL